MKKLFTLFSLILISLSGMSQNDTLLYENFDIDPTGNANWAPIPAIPPGLTNDLTWYNFDFDGLADQSGGSRPGEWYHVDFGFADADSLDGCMWSNSWTLDAVNPVKNYLITPAIQIVDTNATVSWASAPRQTPHYLDGYVVVVSTTTNVETQFTDTLFTAAENEGHVDTIPGFNNFYFIPPGEFIHGLDSTYIEYQGDSIRFIGIQRPFSASLSAYSGQTIYIAFVHFTHDDNLLCLDDILVKGTSPNSVNDITRDAMKLYSYPNPANKNIHLNFTLDKASDATVTVTDVLGNVVLKETLNNISGKYSYTMSVEKLAAGTYYYTVTSNYGRSANKFVIIK